MTKYKAFICEQCVCDYACEDTAYVFGCFLFINKAPCTVGTLIKQLIGKWNTSQHLEKVALASSVLPICMYRNKEI